MSTSLIIERGGVEYDCEGCAVHVYAAGISEPPKHGFCCMCLFLNEMEGGMTAEEMVALSRQMRGFMAPDAKHVADYRPRKS